MHAADSYKIRRFSISRSTKLRVLVFLLEMCGENRMNHRSNKRGKMRTVTLQYLRLYIRCRDNIFDTSATSTVVSTSAKKSVGCP